MHAVLSSLTEYGILALAGWTSGISLYLTVALLGISSRMGWLHLPGGMDTLSHPLIIGLALILYFIEFVADKVPYVDSAWDSIHTIIRPVGAGAVGALAGTENGPVMQTAFALAAGTFALNAHALKASSRLAINTSPEPFSNIAASVAEDTLVIFLFWFFAKHPVLACLLVLVLFVVSIYLVRLLWKFAAVIFRKIFKPSSSPPGNTAQARSPAEE